MLYVVQVDHKSLRARSDPMPAATALKVAKAWQSHGDRGVQIVETGPETEDRRSWSIRDFILFSRLSTSQKHRDTRTRHAELTGDVATRGSG